MHIVVHDNPDPSQLPPATFFRRCDSRPMTGAERMAAFRKRNPGYDRIYKAKRRAELKAYSKAQAALRAEAQVMKIAIPTQLALPAPTPRLALPAPIVDPVVLAMNEMIANLAKLKSEQLVTIER